MGNDGGDIPRRKQLVKEKKKVEVASSQSIARARSKFCNLSNQKFQQPLAICRLGCLYNYEILLDAMVRKILSEKYAYIRKKSDIKQIKIQRTAPNSQNFFMCPITKLEYNGFNKFVAIWNCGHAISRKAFKEVKVQTNSTQGEQQNRCIVCDEPYDPKDIIDLNQQSAQMNQKRAQLIKETLRKLEKKKQEKGDKLNEDMKLGEPKKKLKMDTHINALDRLSGEFRDVLRQRKKFKEVFSKNGE